MKRLFEPFLRPSSKHQNFDPYSEWLQIPVEQQPPNLYQLLGLPLFESDTNEIGKAANRQKTRIDESAKKQHLDLAKQLKSEIEEATKVLLDPVRCEAYNSELSIPGSQSGESSNLTGSNEGPNRDLAQDLLDEVISENTGLKEKSTKLIKISRSYQNELQQKEEAIQNLNKLVESLRSGNDELCSQKKQLEGNQAKSDVEFQNKMAALSAKVTELESSLDKSNENNLALKHELEQTKAEKKKIRDKAAKYRSQLVSIKAEKGASEHELTRLQDEARSRANDNVDLVSQIGQLREELNAKNLEFENTLRSVEANDQAVLAKLQERDNKIKDLQCSLDELKSQVTNSLKPDSNPESLCEARPTESNPAKAAKQSFEADQKDRPDREKTRLLKPQSITLSSQSSLLEDVENAGASSLPSGSIGAGDDQMQLRFRVRDRKTNRIYFQKVVDVGEEFCIGRVTDFCSDKTGVAPYVKDRQLSGRHFKFIADESGILFTDVGSTNGTNVGNENLKDTSKTMTFDAFQDGLLTVRAGELMRYEFELEVKFPAPEGNFIVDPPLQQEPKSSLEEAIEDQQLTKPAANPEKDGQSSLVDPGSVFDFENDDSKASSRNESSRDSIDWG